MGGATMQVEIAYALPDRQELTTLTLPEGATIADAIARSGIDRRFPETDLGRQPTGIWGRRAARDRILQEGDRVEIYRSLPSDPRAERRERAAHGKAMGQH